jgi:hypothetical protein
MLETSHSVFMWTGMLIAGLYWPAALPLGLGGVVHVIVDMGTHANPRIRRKDDPWYAWPLFDLKTMGVWDYRWSAKTRLWPPKPFEALVLVGALTATLVLLLR